MLRLQELAELLNRKTVVSVRVDSSDDLHKFLLECVSAVSSQESAQIAGRDEAASVTFDRMESSVEIVVAASQQFVLKLFNLTLKANFLLNNSQESMLDVVGQVVKTATAHSMSIQSDVAQAVVLAREEHLQKATKKSC